MTSRASLIQMTAAARYAIADPIRIANSPAYIRLRQVDIVDRIPNAALPYGFHPDAGSRSEALKVSMQTVHDDMVMTLRGLVADNAGTPELVAAYRARIAKESGGKNVSCDPQFQRAARQKTEQLLNDLEQDLAAGRFACTNGPAVSLADLLWGVNFVRLNTSGGRRCGARCLASQAISTCWRGGPPCARKPSRRRSIRCRPPAT